MLSRYARCLRLNLRVARLALGGRWLTPTHVAASYDALAGEYDTTWLPHLLPVTEELLGRLPAELPDGAIADLGCGTGHAAAWLADRYPGRSLTAVDLSPGMLDRCRDRLGARPAELVCDDLQEWLAGAGQPLALAFSGWAIGYADPARVIELAARRLVPGGCFAFCVNLADTLGPLFLAYRRTMAAFPDQVQCALRPRFPRDWLSLADALRRAGLQLVWHGTGRIPLPAIPEPRLAWLLRTGVLAGFDSVLPLTRDGPVPRFLESQLAEALAQDPQALSHHYVSAVARKS